MARRINMSTFTAKDYALALPTLKIPRFMPPEQRGWDFTQHRSIKDCVPVREVNEDHIFFGGEFVASRKHVLAHADSGHYKMGRAHQTDLHSFDHGYARHNKEEHFGTQTRKSQLGTIKNKREEAVREMRRRDRFAIVEEISRYMEPPADIFEERLVCLACGETIYGEMGLPRRFEDDCGCKNS